MKTHHVSSTQPRYYLKQFIFLIVSVIGIGTSVSAQADETFKRLENKFTNINPRGAGVISQPSDGFWWWTVEARGRAMAPSAPDLYRHTVMRENKWLLVHTGASFQIDESIRPNQRKLIGEGVSGVVGQFKYNGRCLNGLTQTSEVQYPNKPPQCPQYYWWTPSQMCIAKDHRTGKLTTSGYRHDPETCQQDKNKPMSSEVRLERFLGAAFVPIVAGKYLYTIAVTAQGQLLVGIKLAWDYRTLQRKSGRNIHKVRVYLGAQTSGRQYDVLAAGGASGTHVFSTYQGGQYHFIVDVHDDSGRVLHSDHLLADMN